MNTSTQGALAEAQAAQYLINKGHHIIGRNFRTTGGEIDIITSIKKTLVFVEVKQRASNAFGGPIAAVTPAKQKRIAQTAVEFIKTHQDVIYDSIRFDVICMLPTGIEHIENAFTPCRMTL